MDPNFKHIYTTIYSISNRHAWRAQLGVTLSYLHHSSFPIIGDKNMGKHHSQRDSNKTMNDELNNTLTTATVVHLRNSLVLIFMVASMTQAGYNQLKEFF